LYKFFEICLQKQHLSASCAPEVHQWTNPNAHTRADQSERLRMVTLPRREFILETAHDCLQLKSVSFRTRSELV